MLCSCSTITDENSCTRWGRLPYSSDRNRQTSVHPALQQQHMQEQQQARPHPQLQSHICSWRKHKSSTVNMLLLLLRLLLLRQLPRSQPHSLV